MFMVARYGLAQGSGARRSLDQESMGRPQSVVSEARPGRSSVSGDAMSGGVVLESAVSLVMEHELMLGIDVVHEMYSFR